MKTITNRSKNERILCQRWDEDSGNYDYFFTNCNDERIYRVEKLLPNGKKQISYKKEENAGYYTSDSWRLKPGEKIQVPTHQETFAQCAMRSGQFSAIRQARKES